LNEYNEERKILTMKDEASGVIETDREFFAGVLRAGLVQLPGSDEITSMQIKPWTDTREGHMEKYGVHEHAMCRARGYFDREGSCKDPSCTNRNENHTHYDGLIPRASAPVKGIKMPIVPYVPSGGIERQGIIALTHDELRKNYEDRLVAEVNSWTDQKRGYVYKLLNAQGMRINDAEELIRKAKFDEM